MLAHIRNGALIKTYSDEKGWVDLEDGQRASPPVAGYINGVDSVVEMIDETIDISTYPLTVITNEIIVEANRVVNRKTISNLPEAEAKARVRNQRDDLLDDTDWATSKAIDQNARDGLGVQIPLVWLDYRQALRDITNQDGFPYNVIWPQEP